MACLLTVPPLPSRHRGEVEQFVGRSSAAPDRVVVGDPVGDGFVASLTRPGGNITGFGTQEEGVAGKWVELLTEIAPSVKRATIIFNPDTAPGGGSYLLSAFEAAARSLKVEPIKAPAHNDAEIETVIASLGQEPDGGLVVMPDGFMLAHRAQIVLLAARHRLAVVYNQAMYVKDGGLISYGPVEIDIFRRAASYVDRILRGEKPGELPVQLPIKFEMASNAKTGKGLGLTIPETLSPLPMR
jgi:putative tryptophan/tyrosine transport system substrate-binding protein